MKKIIDSSILFAVFTLVAVATAKADTVVWYTFDDLTPGDTLADGTNIVNKAKPGTHDATMYGMYGTTKTSDTAPAWMPYVTNGVPESLRVLDPVGGTMASAADKALHFKRTHGAGSGAMLEIPNDPALRPSSFTVEMFIRLDPTQSNWEMIASQPSTTAELYGWGINIYRPVDNSYVNFMLNFVDTAGGNHQHGIGTSQGSNALLDYKWHHIALTVTPQSGDPSKINIKFYLDYVRVYNYDAPYGIVLPDSADCPVQIGGTTVAGQLFAGEIGEFRFSDEALGLGEFLRPHNAEIDKDVVLYYDFEDFSEDWSWFSAGSGDVVNKANPGIMDGTFVTRNDYSPEIVAESPAERLRQSMLDPTYENSEKALQNRIIDSSHRQTGYLTCTPLDEDWLAKTNFTIETFFKTANLPQPYVALFQRFGGSNVQLKFGINSGGNQLGINISTNTTAQIENNWYMIPSDEWHHAALVVNQTGEDKKIDLYIDGARKGGMSLDANLASQDKEGMVHNGTWYFAGATGNSFDVTIDSMRVTLRALGPAEFMTSRGCPQGSTITRLSFEDGTPNASAEFGTLCEGRYQGTSGFEPTYSDDVPGVIIRDGEAGDVLTKHNLKSISFPDTTNHSWFAYGALSSVNKPTDVYYLHSDTNGVKRTAGTVEFWMKSSQTDADWDAVVLDLYKSGGAAWAVSFNGNHQIQLGFGASKAGWKYAIASGVNVLDGKWHHVAFTYGPNAENEAMMDAKAYVDYNCIATKTAEGHMNLDSTNDYFDFRLGGQRGHGHSDKNFGGLIDELRISDCALEPSQFLRAENAPGFVIFVR